MVDGVVFSELWSFVVKQLVAEMDEILFSRANEKDIKTNIVGQFLVACDMWAAGNDNHTVSPVFLDSLDFLGDAGKGWGHKGIQDDVTRLEFGREEFMVADFDFEMGIQSFLFPGIEQDWEREAIRP